MFVSNNTTKQATRIFTKPALAKQIFYGACPLLLREKLLRAFNQTANLKALLSTQSTLYPLSSPHPVCLLIPD
jgi:hypothetical protein